MDGEINRIPDTDREALIDQLDSLRADAKEAEEWAFTERDPATWYEAIQDVSALSRAIEIVSRRNA